MADIITKREDFPLLKQKGGFRMKGFLKFISSVAALFAAAVGALLVADRMLNKNRIKGDYLECDTPEDEK